MSYSDYDRIVALAGVFQAARLVRDIARTGQFDNTAYSHSIESLFTFDPESTAAVFGGELGISSGLRAIVTQLENPRERDIEVAQYVISMIHLATQLQANGKSLDELAEALDSLQQRQNDFDLSSQTRTAQLADLYQSHISEITPQIMVRGEPLHLQNSDNAARVRSALLAGIRAAVLWRQCGGKKRQLLFSRGRIVKLAHEILKRN